MGTPGSKKLVRKKNRQTIHSSAKFIPDRRKYPPLVREPNQTCVVRIYVGDKIGLERPT
jgi:hypothetical protein